MPRRDELDKPPVGLDGLQGFADELGLTLAEIITFARVRNLDVPDTESITELPFAVVVALREDLDQYCVRTVPAFWWPGIDPQAGTGATKMTFDHRRRGPGSAR
jgi:hypothetical protein